MDVLTSPVEFDKETVDSSFRLVNIVAQRAKELAIDENPKINSHYKKVTTIALEEASRGILEFIIGPEAKLAKEKARKLDHKRFLEERQRTSEQEDLSELEKDLKFYLHEKDDADKQKIDTLFMKEEEKEQRDSNDNEEE